MSIKISGRFNANSNKNFYEFTRFFFFQNRLRNGQSVKNIGVLIIYMLKMIKQKIVDLKLNI